MQYQVLKANFHTHTSEQAGDYSYPHYDGFYYRDLIDKFAEEDYDFLAITEHHADSSKESFAEGGKYIKSKGYALTLLVGYEHKFADKHEELWLDINGERICMLCHPFRYKGVDPYWRIETSKNEGIRFIELGKQLETNPGELNRLIDYLQAEKLIPIANSDLHGDYFYIYRQYTLVIVPDRSEAALKAALLAGNTVAHYVVNEQVQLISGGGALAEQWLAGKHNSTFDRSPDEFSSGNYRKGNYDFTNLMILEKEAKPVVCDLRATLAERRSQQTAIRSSENPFRVGANSPPSADGIGEISLNGKTFLTFANEQLQVVFDQSRCGRIVMLQSRQSDNNITSYYSGMFKDLVPGEFISEFSEGTYEYEVTVAATRTEILFRSCESSRQPGVYIAKRYIFYHDSAIFEVEYKIVSPQGEVPFKCWIHSSIEKDSTLSEFAYFDKKANKLPHRFGTAIAVDKVGRVVFENSHHHQLSFAVMSNTPASFVCYQGLREFSCEIMFHEVILTPQAPLEFKVKIEVSDEEQDD
ncbi:MAG: hypothetical protein L3J71_01600 [Victivallaceae bacterium]|nr:hypothetical protein [Victivallaceae bacterium]